MNGITHTLCIAHRGFSGSYPENTLLAFEKAIEAGADGIELDVHLSKDGVPVICHDEELNRTTNGSGLLCEYTLEELKTFDASYIYKGKYGVNRIPTLREYFELIQATRLITNIELKNGCIDYPGLEQKVLELIDEFRLRGRIILSSFNHYSVQRAKRLAPDIPCGLLYDAWLVNAQDYCKDVGADCLHPSYYCLTQEAVSTYLAAGLQINTWTVNDPEDMRRLASLGVTAVITNYPDRFLEAVGR